MTSPDAMGPWTLTGARVRDSDVMIGKTALILRRFRRDKAAVAGLVIFLALTAFSLAGGFFTSWDRSTIDPFQIGSPPSPEHLLGTSQAGIDLYSMVVDGTRASILIGVTVGLLSALFAAVYGCTMAYFGGMVDKVMLFILEALIMMPALLVLAVVTSGAGDGLRENVPGWLLLMLVLLVFSWMGSARMIRSLAMSLMQRDFIKAARFMGIPGRRIIWRHLVPNVGSLLVLDTTRGITGAILAEVAFAFIGIGIRAPDVSLGVLIAAGTSQLQTFPWMFWAPFLVMILLTASLALLNDGLRDALDPGSGSFSKSRKKGVPRRTETEGRPS